MNIVASFDFILTTLYLLLNSHSLLTIKKAQENRLKWQLYKLQAKEMQ